MKLPRVNCPTCGRPIAAGPVAGALGKGRLWRHDEPGMRAEYQGALVSCADSLAVVDLPTGAHQLELGADATGQVPADVAALLF